MALTVTATFPHERHRKLARSIHERSLAEARITPRPQRVLRRALRRGRLVVAERDGDVVGWFLSEPCGAGVHELGYLYVDATARGDGMLLRLLDVGMALDRRAVAVTFRREFADWLVSGRGFRHATLGELVRVSRGWFLVRRLAPRRLITALRRTSSGEAHYLVHEGGAE